MVWLAEHGYLSFEANVRQEALDQAVLSQKAFLLLSSRSNLEPATPSSKESLPPSVLEESLANIAQLRHALREGSSITLQRCVRYLLAHPPIGA